MHYQTCPIVGGMWEEALAAHRILSYGLQISGIWVQGCWGHGKGFSKQCVSKGPPQQQPHKLQYLINTTRQKQTTTGSPNNGHSNNQERGINDRNPLLTEPLMGTTIREYSSTFKKTGKKLVKIFVPRLR